MATKLIQELPLAPVACCAPVGQPGITDEQADTRAERGSYVVCIAGALSFAEYEQGLVAAGFPGMHSAIVKASKVAAPIASAPSGGSAQRELPVLRSSCG